MKLSKAIKTLEDAKREYGDVELLDEEGEPIEYITMAYLADTTPIQSPVILMSEGAIL